jgi:hypothetical protein
MVPPPCRQISYALILCQRPSNFDATSCASQKNFSRGMAFTRQHFGIKHHIAFCSIWNVHCRPDLVSIPALLYPEQEMPVRQGVIE